MFEDKLAPAVVAQKAMVATINLRTTAYAERHVFAGRDSYLTINDQGEIYEYQADISP
jgi:hypothetical protein